MDRMDPVNFDHLTHERRTEVRNLEIEHFPNGENPWARGHEFRLGFDVGPNTRQAISANAAELRRWAKELAEAALRFAEDLPEHDAGEEPTCPVCRGDVHVDLAGAIWSTTAAAADRARALHRPEWRDEVCLTPRKGCDRPDCRIVRRGEVTPWRHYHEYGYQVCSHCVGISGDGIEYPCPTIRAMDGEAGA